MQLVCNLSRTVLEKRKLSIRICSQLEVASDVISSGAVEDVGLHVHIKFGDSKSNISRLLHWAVCIFLLYYCVFVQLESKDDELHSFIFISDDALTTPDRLLILIHGSGVVRAGQWARRYLIGCAIFVFSDLKP